MNSFGNPHVDHFVHMAIGAAHIVFADSEVLAPFAME